MTNISRSRSIEAPGDDDFDSSRPDHPYLVVQRQFEDDDGGVCYIETHDHDTYTGHSACGSLSSRPHASPRDSQAGQQIRRGDLDLDAKRFGDVQRIVRIVFGVKG